jgi:hypothetical protein
MLPGWAVALVAVVFLVGCSVVETNRLDMPSSKRHFIVMATPPLP